MKILSNSVKTNMYLVIVNILEIAGVYLQYLVTNQLNPDIVATVQ